MITFVKENVFDTAGSNCNLWKCFEPKKEKSKYFYQNSNRKLVHYTRRKKHLEELIHWLFLCKTSWTSYLDELPSFGLLNSYFITTNKIPFPQHL